MAFLTSVPRIFHDVDVWAEPGEPDLVVAAHSEVVEDPHVGRDDVALEPPTATVERCCYPSRPHERGGAVAVVNAWGVDDAVGLCEPLVAREPDPSERRGVAGAEGFLGRRQPEAVISFHCGASIGSKPASSRLLPPKLNG